MTIQNWTRDLKHLNRSITSSESEAAIQSPKKDNPRPEGLTAEFYYTFKKELIPTLFKLFHKIGGEETLPNTFYETSITFFSKPDKDTTKKKKKREREL
jgi:hypothetical protein